MTNVRLDDLLSKLCSGLSRVCTHWRYEICPFFVATPLEDYCTPTPPTGMQNSILLVRFGKDLSSYGELL